MPDPDRCPRCDSLLRPGSPVGLCPLCLLREGLELGPSADGSTQRLGTAPSRSAWSGGRPSVAETLGVSPGVVLLEDGTDPSPVALSGSAEVPPRDSERYQLLGEIARGGMGAVLKGRDTELGRELAVKVLLSAHRDSPAMVRRFVEEAQIGGQLQHPGIVPVYELGVFADRRPYFTMKLVRGRTLAALLERRTGPADDLPRSLAIFEQVCQTVAYAHAHKVVHRDLKPSNVMVGSFGEVQVMDWGLAKVLAAGGVADEAATPREVRTARTGPDSAAFGDATRAGSVMGTPGYMAPEQARGEVDRLDERCDVFALGAILCEILTGRPPFAATSRDEALRMAAAGETAEALARLDSSGADPDLIGLARRCLEADPSARPRDAGELARAMSAHLAGVQDRLRAAELARVEAQARAEEERKRRRAELRLSAVLVAVLALGALGVGTQWRRAERHLADARDANARLTESQARTSAARDQALARLGLAIEAVDTYTTGVSGDLLLKERRLAGLRADLLGSALAYQRKLQAMMEADPDGSPAELAASYERVARLSSDVGKKGDALTVLEQALRVRERLAREQPGDRDGRLALARIQHSIGRTLIELTRPADAERPLAACVATCESLLRERGDDPQARFRLAQAENERGNALREQGRLADAVRLYERAAGLLGRVVLDRPDDPAPRNLLAELLASLAWEDFAAGRARAAVRRIEEAERHFEALTKAHPREPTFRQNLGILRDHYAGVLMSWGKVAEARRLAGRAIVDFEALAKEQPNVSQFQVQLAFSHITSHQILFRSGKTVDSLSEVRAALAIFERLAAQDPDAYQYQHGLGVALAQSGDALRVLGRMGEAVAAAEQALAVRRRLSDRNPGNRDSRSALISSHVVLAAAYFEARRPDDALREYRRSAEMTEASTNLYPDDWYNLGCVHARIATLTGAGRAGPGTEPSRHADRAVAALRRAIALGYRSLVSFQTDPDLEPLRGRADFRDLLLDLAFPDDPFAAPR